MCACEGGCRDQLGKLTFPKGNSSYTSNIAQGRALCTHCNHWVHWKFCHLKNNIPALPDSLGMFCNCCGYRVRQQPKSKRSKELLKGVKPDSKKNQTNLRKQMASATTIEESREIMQKIRDEIQSGKKVQKNESKNKSKIVWNEQKQDWDIVEATDHQKYEKKISENSGNNELEDDDVIDTGKTLDELRELFEEKFSDNPQLLKQFQRLEKYLTLLPNNKKYENVSYFIH